MKRLLLLAVALGTVTFFVVGAGKSGDTEEFSRLLKDFYAAWSGLDVEKAGTFYAKEADLVFFDLAPLKYDHGWQQYRDNFKATVAPMFASLSLTPHDDLKVIREGKVALTTSTFHVTAKMKSGESMDFDGRHTLFWERRHGQWVIVHEHASKPL